MKKLLLIISLVTVTNINAQDENFTFQAFLSDEFVRLDENFRLEFRINAEAENFTPPKFKNFKIVSGPKQSSNNTVINGKRTYTKSFVYFLSPVRKGFFRIGEAKIYYQTKSYRTKALEIEVGEIISDDYESVKELNDKRDIPTRALEIPFATVEDAPLFPGCETIAKSKRRQCFQEQMNKHISKNFSYPKIAQEMGIQGRVFVQFIISNDGTINGIKTRGPDKNLEEEAYRIISLLPKMIPGKQNGESVNVPFSVPIEFKLQ